MTDTAALRSRWAERVRTRRQELGLTQFQVATAAGLQQATVSQIERGEHAGSDETRIALARALKTEVADLFAYPSITEHAAERAS